MAKPYTDLRYHCIWSTKDRAPLIQPEIEEAVWRLLATTATKHDLRVIRAGGIENHVHVLVEIPKTIAVAEAMKRHKGGSSNAVNEADLIRGRFSWQDGYGAFTVSRSQAPDVVRYINDQRTHHRARSFEDEYVALLEKHEVDYDPKYLFG